MGERFQLGAVEIDLGKGVARRPAGEIRLTEMETRLLRYLIDQEGQAVSREQLLTAVWAYSSRARSRTVDTTVRRLRQKVESDPVEPRFLLTVYGVGYRLLAPTPTSVMPRPGNRFFGRSALLARIKGADGAVALVGPPGVGKSRLALEAWAEVSARRVDGAALGRGLGELLDVERLDETDKSHASRLEAVIVGRRPERLLIDDLAEIGPVERRLLTALIHTGHRLLITSLTAPKVAGVQAIGVGGLAPGPAAALLADRCGEVQVAPEIAAALVAALDHLPLAIEMVPPLLAFVRPEQLLQRLHHRLDLLVDAEGGSLRVALDAAWESLPPPLQTFLARCSAFVEPFDVEAAEAVHPPDGPPAVVALRQLHERGLLVQVQPRRFRLEANLRHYALETAPALHEAGLVRHDRFFREDREPAAASLHAMASRVRTPQDADTLLSSRLRLLRALGLRDAERQLLDLAVQLGRPDRIVQRARLHRLEGEATRSADLLSDLSELLQGPPRAAALAELARARFALGDLPLARQIAASAMDHVGSDATIHGQVASTVGLLALRAGDFVPARQALTEAIAWLELAGDADGLAVASLNCLRAMVGAGEADAAAHLLASVVERPTTPARRGLLGLVAGHVHLAVGAFEEADLAWQDASSAYLAQGHGRDALLCRLYRCWILLETGTPAVAAQALTDCLDLMASRRATDLAPVAWTWLGLARWKAGDRVGADTLLQRAAEAHLATGDVRSAAYAHALLAIVSEDGEKWRERSSAFASPDPGLAALRRFTLASAEDAPNSESDPAGEPSAFPLLRFLEACHK